MRHAAPTSGSLDFPGAATMRSRMQLSAALGWSLLYGVGRAREAGPALATTLDLAERLGEQVYRLRALWSLCIDQFNNGNCRRALELPSASPVWPRIPAIRSI